jgi:phosphoglucosamine mutase
VNGDAVLLMCARHLQQQGRLPGNAIVATVMSNIGLEIALRESGIEMIRTAVGDKYVMEEMLKRGIALGGEQSGHVIFSDYLFTGDGLCTALNVLQTVPAVAAAIADVDARVAGHGRLLVRYSGTEPLLRVMLEGQDQNEIRSWAQHIIDVVTRELA